MPYVHVCVISLFLSVCSMNGALAFVDTSDCTMMNIAEHYMASDVEWDPTGRYVVTSVSWWSHKVQTAPIPLNQSTLTFIHSYWPWPVPPYRWTMHTGCGRSRVVFFRRTTRTGSASFSGDPDLLPCSVVNRSRYRFVYLCSYTSQHKRVEPVMTNFNFSDTSYESCTVAPDSNTDLRLNIFCIFTAHTWNFVGYFMTNHTLDLWALQSSLKVIILVSLAADQEGS